MPRTADHEARRAQLCTAVREIALTKGLHRVTVADTAAAAGVSVGLVQHYFPTKASLLGATHRHVLSGVELRVDAAVARAEQRRERIEEIMVEALAQLLPLDRQRHEEVTLTLAFGSLALTDPDLREAQQVWDRHLQHRITTAVTNGIQCGEVPSTADVAPIAYALRATVEGLARDLHTRGTAYGRNEAGAALAWTVAQAFPGVCVRAGR